MQNQPPEPIKVDSRWVRFRAGAYLRGRGLSWGTSQDPIFPMQALDVDKFSLNIDIVKTQFTDVFGQNLDIFAKDSMDHIFVGAREKAPFQALVSKLKLGGHLVVHAVNADPELIRKAIEPLGIWKEKDTYTREMQFLGVWKLVARSGHRIDPPTPKPAKRALIARYGAIGDMIMISPLIKQLKQDGYHVTMNVTPYCAEVLKNNPYVDNIVLQERDIIPNPDLGDYWKEWMPDYDKYINLSESIEGKLLKVEGRRDFYTSKEWRRKMCDEVNYYDQTLRLGGYPDIVGTRGEMYFSNSEIKEAKHFRAKVADKFLISWSLKGSSHHKQYPLIAPIMSDWLDSHPDARLVLTGAPGEEAMQFEHPQVLGVVGKFNLRQVFCLQQFVDLAVGPESAVINAAACFDTPKIVLLSHSTHTNLCKYWTNHQCLAPENVPCYPCHQLHYSKESCPQISIIDPKTNQSYWDGPACAGSGISGERVQKAIDAVYNKWTTNRITA